MSKNIKMNIDQDGIAVIEIDVQDRPMNVITVDFADDFKNCVEQVLGDEKIIGAVVTSAKNEAVTQITAPTIKVLVAPAPTKAKTVSSVEIGAARISLIVPLNFGKNIPNEVLLIEWVSNVNINKPGTIYEP